MVDTVNLWFKVMVIYLLKTKCFLNRPEFTECDIILVSISHLIPDGNGNTLDGSAVPDRKLTSTAFISTCQKQISYVNKTKPNPKTFWEECIENLVLFLQQ